MRKSLTRDERLRKVSDLKPLFSQGRRVGCPGSRLVIRRTGLPRTRVAVLPARGYRRAVDRNRDKRVIREWYREVKHLIPTGYDLGIILYPGSHSAHDRRAQVAGLLRRAGLLSGNEPEDESRNEPEDESRNETVDG